MITVEEEREETKRKVEREEEMGRTNTRRADVMRKIKKGGTCGAGEPNEFHGSFLKGGTTSPTLGDPHDFDQTGRTLPGQYVWRVKGYLAQHNVLFHGGRESDSN